jgi:ribosomal protein L11 methyltransferase
VADAAWLEVSLSVKGELAEAVAEVLSRFAPNGVVIENTEIDGFQETGWLSGEALRVCAYLPADEKLEATRHKLEEALWHLGQIEPLPAPTFTSIQDTNWMEAWKKHYRPIPIGKKLIVLPAWVDSHPEDRLPVYIDPGMAFGTGAHPSTQLSLLLLEEFVQPGQAVIDVGCGSGILAIAAAKLGANPILGVDIDADAIPLARQNAQANQTGEKIVFAQGSVKDILGGDFGFNQARVVAANILSHILIELLDEGLSGLVTPDGALILSGILEEKEAALQAALKDHGLAVIKRAQMDDWVGLAAGKTKAV